MPPAKPINTSTYSGKFAANLRRLRRARGLSSHEVVESMRKYGYAVAAKTYASWECHRNDPPMNAIPALAATMGFTEPHELFKSVEYEFYCRAKCQPKRLSL